MGVNPKEGVIPGVIKTQQGAHASFIFKLPARELLKLGVISRLHNNEGGVQRNLNENRAASIALAFQDPSNRWLDTFLVHMEPEGSWRYDEASGSIIYTEGFRLSIDDGQHRRYALEALTSDEVDRVGEFNITASFGLKFEERLALFMQQNHRKSLDRNLLLKGKSLLDKWDRPIEGAAYAAVVFLNNNPASPLYNLVELDEKPHGRRTGLEAQTRLTASGLHSVLKSVLGSKSLLYGLSPEKQQDILLRYLDQAATKVWRSEWEDEEGYIIRWSRGVNSLLRLFYSSKVLRMVLSNDDFGNPRLRNVLALASSFDWSSKTNKLRSESDIAERIDNLMSRTYSHRQKRRERDRAERQ